MKTKDQQIERLTQYLSVLLAVGAILLIAVLIMAGTYFFKYCN